MRQKKNNNKLSSKVNFDLRKISKKVIPIFTILHLIIPSSLIIEIEFPEKIKIEIYRKSLDFTD
jgi:hypothetical protein